MDPALAWAMGCQIAAINFQASDVSLQVNRSRFLNTPGACLRPPFLNDVHTNYSPEPSAWLKGRRVRGGSLLGLVSVWPVWTGAMFPFFA